jgi:glycosyltransferase 2 family protein
MTDGLKILGDAHTQPCATSGKRAGPQIIALPTRRQLVFILIKFAISIVLIAFIFSRISLNTLATFATNLDAWPLLCACILMLMQFPLAGWRWKIVLKSCGPEASIALLQSLVWIGQFVNQVMPTFLVGDGVRAWYLYREGISGRASVSSLLIDRIAGMVGLLVLIVIMNAAIVDRIGASAWTILGLAAIGIGAAAAGCLICKFILGRRFASKWPAFEFLAEHVWKLVTDWRRLTLIMILAFGTNVIASLAAYALAFAFHIELSLLDSLALIPVALFATLIPISIAGWGVRESTLVVLLGWIGIPAEQAFALSIGYGFVTIVAALPGGLIWAQSRESSVSPDPRGVQPSCSIAPSAETPECAHRTAERRCVGCRTALIGGVYFRHATIALYRCEACGSLTALPRPHERDQTALHDNPAYHGHPYFERRRSLTPSIERRCHVIFNQLTRVMEVNDFRGACHLDIGCDTGSMLLAARHIYGTVPVGIDISHRAIAEAVGRGLEAYCCTVETAPDSIRDVSIVTAIDLIEHTIDPAKFLEQVKQRLRPGGICYLETPNVHSNVYRIGRAVARVTGGRPAWVFERLFPTEHIEYFSVNGLRALAKRAGLEVVSLSARALPFADIAASLPVRIVMTAIQATDAISGQHILLCMVARRSVS